MQEQELNFSDNVIYAGFWPRVAACIIDSIIITIPMLLINFILYFISKQINIPTITVIVTLGTLLLDTAIYGLYGGLFESSQTQATPGKMLLKLKVTDINGKRCTFVRACARYLAMGATDTTFYVGYLMALWTAKKQCLHDKIADCLVVQSS